jgi:hypothetical protein
LEDRSLYGAQSVPDMRSAGLPSVTVMSFTKASSVDLELDPTHAEVPSLMTLIALSVRG